MSEPSADAVPATAATTKKILEPAAALAATAALAACGGGASGSQGGGGTASAPPPISASAAARFLAQASMGADRAQIARVQALGYAGWLDEQIALPASGSRWDSLVSKGYNALSYRNSETGFDAGVWRKLISAPDTLRQRVTLALSEILVVAIDGLVGAGWKAFAAAAYLDLLEANCFGNYRNLLQQVSTSPAMGMYLTFRGNTKYNAATGALPDENYAREVMQLFSIGLLQLNPDGTPQLQNGAHQETYGLDDISGLARVFTGWEMDWDAAKADTPDFLRRPMVQVASRHETGAASFLGSTVPAGLSGEDSLKAALDILFAHANVAPFISRQLIQRLVTSNPAPAYVARVAAVFGNDGGGVKGNLQAVIKAILLDDEARNSANLTNPQFGKLREPILRLLAWARAYHANSASDAWGLGNTSDPASRLGQSPTRSPSVFNFFRPGYVPPNSAIATAALVAPEFQIANESSVVGYVNFMQRAVSTGIGDVLADYSSLLPLADNAPALLDEINLVLAAGQLSSATLNNLSNAVAGIAGGSDANRYRRIYAALTLVLAAPEFIVLK
ncbi:MAG: DUF1800 domain-containing protein [Burkholderiales bacterium]|nr:DUF1800 domain-containing protein [Burkholderiales bacterium]